MTGSDPQPTNLEELEWAVWPSFALPNSVFKPYASIGTNLLFFVKGEPTKEIW